MSMSVYDNSRGEVSGENRVHTACTHHLVGVDGRVRLNRVSDLGMIETVEKLSSPGVYPSCDGSRNVVSAYS